MTTNPSSSTSEDHRLNTESLAAAPHGMPWEWFVLPR